MVNEKGLSQLAERKINLGAIGSGTHSLATSVLRFVGLRMDSEQGDAHYHPNEMSNRQTACLSCDDSRTHLSRGACIARRNSKDCWDKTFTVAGGTFFVVQWYLRSNRRRREASFASNMKRVMQIENESMQNELAAQLDLASLIRLQRELAALKSEAVSRFATGKLEGEGLIHGFLGLVNDARNQLTWLILHQRENIEEIAASQNHSIGEV